MPPAPHRATLVFDVNETLTDQQLFAHRLVEVGAPGSLADIWYAGALRDGIALSLLDRARPYADVARAVLLGLLHRADGLTCSIDAAADHVMAGFEEIGPHPDVVDGVRALAAAGHRLVTLSNGNPRVARGMLERAGVADAFSALLSAEDAGAWKPHPRAYQHAAQRTGTPPAGLTMVAVHPWDLAGAARVGMRTAFLDRTGAPWPAVFDRPDLHVTALTELPGALEP